MGITINARSSDQFVHYGMVYSSTSETDASSFAGYYDDALVWATSSSPVPGPARQLLSWTAEDDNCRADSTERVKFKLCKLAEDFDFISATLLIVPFVHSCGSTVFVCDHHDYCYNPSAGYNLWTQLSALYPDNRKRNDGRFKLLCALRATMAELRLVQPGPRYSVDAYLPLKVTDTTFVYQTEEADLLALE